MEIEVVHFSWAHEDESYPGGPLEIEKPTKKQLAAIGAAAALSDPPIRVVSASKEERAAMANAVQSQEESEKIQADAQKSGEWQKGNLLDFIARATTSLKIHDEALASGSLDGRLDEQAAAWLEVGLHEAERIQKRIEQGDSYDEAVDAVKGA